MAEESPRLVDQRCLSLPPVSPPAPSALRAQGDAAAPVDEERHRLHGVHLLGEPGLACRKSRHLGSPGPAALRWPALRLLHGLRRRLPGQRHPGPRERPPAPHEAPPADRGGARVAAGGDGLGGRLWAAGHGAAFALDWRTGAVVVGYIGLMVTYTFCLKYEVILDVMVDRRGLRPARDGRRLRRRRADLALALRRDGARRAVPRHHEAPRRGGAAAGRRREPPLDAGALHAGAARPDDVDGHGLDGDRLRAVHVHGGEPARRTTR